MLKTNHVKRGRYGEFLVEGVRNLNAAKRFGWDIRAVIYASGGKLSDWAEDYISSAGADKIELTADLMQKLSGKTDVSELMAVVGMKDDDPARITFKGTPLLALFDRPSNHGNLGTMIRSCDSCGVDGLIITGHAADLYAPETVAATMGSFFKVPCIRIQSNEGIEDYISSLRQRYPDLLTVGTTAHKEKTLWDVDLTRPTVFFIGNETDGLSAFDGDRPPDQSLHGILGFDPGAACRRPAGSGSDRKLQSQGIRGPDSIGKCILPSFIHVNQSFIDDRGRSKGRIEIMDATQADSGHPFEVLPDTVLGHVSVHPMPPYPRTGSLGRVCPTGLQIGKRRLGCLFSVLVRRTAGKYAQGKEEDRDSLHIVQ